MILLAVILLALVLPAPGIFCSLSHARDEDDFACIAMILLSSGIKCSYHG
jgi:hypothetical protein